jgi:predicted nucleic acid-binding protein
LIFLDTNVVSEPVKPKPDPIVTQWIGKHQNELVMSTIVLGEIAAGIESIRPNERAKRLDGFLRETHKHYANRIYNFDEASALIYGQLIGAAVRSGKNLDAVDAMIAAIAIRHSATLATRNVKDFEWIKMKLVNPWEG